MRDRRSTISNGGESGGAGPSPAIAPGRSTLTQAMQCKAAEAAGPAAAPAPASTGPGSPLPGAVQAKMDSAFNFDFSSVRVHEGEQAPAMGASAYTQGADLHFAPGQYQPGSQRGQELIGHELAHVVQQSEGRVGATRQFKGVELNDDPGLESEADAWGALAARGAPVGRSGGASAAGPGAAVQRKVIQRAPQPSHWGRFVDTAYTQSANGVNITLTFEPGEAVDATNIGITQTVKTVLGGATSIIDPSQEGRLVGGTGPGAGSRIDRLSSSNNPIYGSPSLGASQGLGDTAQSNAPSGATPSPTNATFELGHRFTDAGGPHIKNAWMRDAPSAPSATPNSSMTFETTALALSGAQQGEYYGSVKWGWERNATGALSQVPFAIVSQGTPSDGFLAAASAWNSATVRGTLVARQDPTNVYGSPGGSVSFTIAKDTTVTDSGAFMSGGIAYRQVTIGGSGSHAGANGYARVSDLRDQGDGPATADLPTPDVRTLVGPQRLNDGVSGPWRDTGNLPAGTRVTPTIERPGSGVPQSKLWIRVVDGPSTGQNGYVDRSSVSGEPQIGDFPDVTHHGDTAMA